LTIIVDDAGSGDLLFGVIVGAYREDSDRFTYEIIDVKYYQELFCEKKYLQEASRIIFNLIKKLKIKPKEEIQICQGSIFDKASEDLKEKYGEELIKRVRVIGELQRLVETSYLDEIRNLGYEPLEDRESKRAKSFFHMMRWIKSNPNRLKFAKTGWPRLKRYKLFNQPKNKNLTTNAVCNKCGKSCKVPFIPDGNRAVFCYNCLRKSKNQRKTRPKNKAKFL
jgi:CxxC-x17-CxxC domain-containing protein